MFIETQATSDPASLKFLPGRPVLPHGTLDIRDRAETARSPLARRLFDVRGVAALTFGPDYITVTKDGGDWQLLKPALLGAIMDHFMSGAPVVSDIAPPAETPGSTDTDALAARIRDALRQVIDPELGYNIVDLGLVYDVSVSEDGTASVVMTTTTPGCPATGYLSEGARAATAAVEGVRMARIRLTYEPRWSPELMSAEAKAHFGIADGGGGR
ncbi:MAG TPA: NifU N-terminal domain-containing protein [Alphaproteobacteria bacterium]